LKTGRFSPLIIKIRIIPMALHFTKHGVFAGVFIASTLLFATFSNATTLDDNLKEMDAANKEAGASQERIQTIQTESQKLANEYKRLLQNADRQEQVNEELGERLKQQ